jgi:hypothetical protein
VLERKVTSPDDPEDFDGFCRRSAKKMGQEKGNKAADHSDKAPCRIGSRFGRRQRK